MAGRQTQTVNQGASTRARGNTQRAPAAAPASNLPPGTVADPNYPAGFRIVDQAAYSAWHAGSIASQKGGTAAQAGGITNATTAGSNDLQADIARRQAAGETLRAPTPTGQFDSGRQVVTTDPAANLRAAQAAGVGGFSSPLTGALSTVQRPAITSTVKTPAAFTNMDLGPTSRVVNPSKAEQGADQARAALGPAPQIDMGLADRQQGTVDAALGLSRQAVDAALQPVDQTRLDASVADARKLLDEMLNGPNTAARIGSQTLRSQLALARSAAGGPGAVAGAFRNAQMGAPELQAQATQAATAETLQRQQAAGNLVNQIQTTETNRQTNETQRLNAASAAASGFAQGALGARGQDIQVAQANQQAASNLLNNVAQLTGTQLELDQRNQELIGQLARDAAAMNFNWGQLSVQQQEAEFERWVKVYGIDQAAAAQIKAAAAANKKTPWDYIIPLVGAAASGGAAAARKPG
jgi:hypothetical protein